MSHTAQRTHFHSKVSREGYRAPVNKPVKDKTAVGATTSSNAACSSTFRDQGSATRRRLPWLDKSASSVEDMQAKRQKSLREGAPPHRMPAAPSPLPKSSSEAGSIRIAMGGIKQYNPPSITEKAKIANAVPREQGLLHGLPGRKGPSSPVLRHDEADDSLPEFDPEPLTRALNRLNDLIMEAEGIVNEAADTAQSVDLEPRLTKKDIDVDETSPAQAPREFLVEASTSELSMDESEVPASRSPVLSRDFAHNYGRRKSLGESGHWMGQIQSRKPSIKHVPNLENIKEMSIDVQNHTRHVSDTTPSPCTPRVASKANSIRHRKPTVKIVEKAKPDEQTVWQKWAEPRQNTFFDQSWQPNPSLPPLQAHKTSTVPIPWNEKFKRKSGHVTLPEIDLEKAEGGGGGGGESRHMGYSWQLGHAKDEPIARRWGTTKKRISAAAACFNTGMVGYMIGDFAGMVPRIQFQLADEKHDVLLGNVYLFIGMALTTFFCWPLPLLHGRKPYILGSLALAVPLQFPQAILVSQSRTPLIFGFEFGLLFTRFVTGLLLGLTNINDLAVLLDVFGASLQSERPHQEIASAEDPRREGGGIGVWLGIWAWCWVGSLSVGFMSGAGTISNLNPQWGFYVSIVLMICVLILNVVVPETRHSSLRRTLHVLRHTGLLEERAKKKVARGEIKLHIHDDGPRYWFQELWAGVILMKRMFFQRGFSIMSLYLGWMYGQNVLVIVLLGALLSREYQLASRYVGLGVASIAFGALLAIPMSHAGLWSRSRREGPRTDSMTFEPQMTWSSHMVRRILFMLMLPIVGVVYAVTSLGTGVHFMVPIVIAGMIGFFQSLAVAECYGLLMETFDTSDLQPGVNSRHRLQSLAETVRKRRTIYSSYPRVSAGIFLSQTIGFLFAAAATAVGGIMSRTIGAQFSTCITAGILLFLTILLTGILLRFRHVQVIPNHAFGTRVGTYEMTEATNDVYWKPVIIGNPSGKVRKMSLLELGDLSRWTEIRRLNKLL